MVEGQGLGEQQLRRVERRLIGNQLVLCIGQRLLGSGDVVLRTLRGEQGRSRGGHCGQVDADRVMRIRHRYVDRAFRRFVVQIGGLRLEQRSLVGLELSAGIATPPPVGYTAGTTSSAPPLVAEFSTASTTLAPPV